MGVSADKIKVIYNGLDFSTLQPRSTRSEVRQRIGLPESAMVVGTVARLHPVKGHQVLLEAASSLEAAYPDLYFLLVGDGPLRAEIEQQISELGLRDRVLLTGFYPEVADIYPALDLFCLPSLMEGMGLVLLEAMHFGLPVVASRVGGIPELVTDGETGLLVPAGDSKALSIALQKLLGDTDLRQNLGQRGQAQVPNFTVDKMVREVEKVYNALV